MTDSPTPPRALRVGTLPLTLLQQLESESAVTLARVAVAAVSLVASLAERSGGSVAEIALLVGYLLYALGIQAFAARRGVPTERWALATHTLDIAAFTTLAVVVGNGGAPFFSVLFLVVVAGAFRLAPRHRKWNLILPLAAVVMIELSALTRGESLVAGGARLALRSLAVTVLAVILGRVAARRERTFSHFAALTHWPVHGPDIETTLAEMLHVAADVFGARAILLAWEDPDEPWRHRALWMNGVLTVYRDPPTSPPAVRDRFADHPFLCVAPDASRATTTTLDPNGFEHVNELPVPNELVDWLGGKRFAGAPFTAPHVRGHLLAIDFDLEGTVDALVLGGTVARECGSSLDQIIAAGRLSESATIEERGRLLRDLHDGILQSLTGIVLRIREARDLFVPRPERTVEILDSLETLVAAEQRDLRMLVMEERDGASDASLEGDLPTRLRDIAHRIGVIWGATVETEIDPWLRLSPVLSRQVIRVAQEALSNAARHGLATWAKLSVAQRDGNVQIRVDDNGRGFPFTGEFTDDVLRDRKLGPVVLKQRAHSLGGTVRISTRPGDTSLEVAIPLERASQMSS